MSKWKNENLGIDENSDFFHVQKRVFSQFKKK